MWLEGISALHKRMDKVLTDAPPTITEGMMREFGKELATVRVGFHNSATGLDLGFYAARSYSLMRPPRTGRRLLRSRGRPASRPGRPPKALVTGPRGRLCIRATGRRARSAARTPQSGAPAGP